MGLNEMNRVLKEAVNRGGMNEQCVQQAAYLAGSAARDSETPREGRTEVDRKRSILS
jgi:hypothetical protein